MCQQQIKNILRNLSKVNNISLDCQDINVAIYKGQFVGCCSLKKITKSWKDIVDHYIEFVNKNTKRMLTIMATWLKGVRHRLMFTKNLGGEFNEECEEIQQKGSTQGKVVKDDQGFLKINALRRTARVNRLNLQ